MKRELIKQIAESVASDDLSTYRKDYSKVSDVFEQDYADFVSPIAARSHNYDADVMIVMQDWSHYDGVKDNDRSGAKIGYNPKLKANIELDKRLESIGESRSSVYMTNAMVHLKHTATIDGAVSAPDMRRSIEKFTLREIDAVRPKVVLVVGSNASAQMRKLVGDEYAGAKIIYMSHPSARISNARKDSEWNLVKEII